MSGSARMSWSRASRVEGSFRRTTSEFEPPWRRKGPAIVSRSAQTSLSKGPPREAKRPTSCQPWRWMGMVAPRSRPRTRCAMRSPTMTSYRPGWKERPRLISIPPRTSKARGVRPRMVTLVAAPSLRRGKEPMTTISGEAKGRPCASVATRESTTSLSRWPSGTQEVSSEADPRWTITAFSGRPVARSAYSNPVRMAIRATNTVTTRAMPVMARRLTCQRARTLRTLYESGRAMGSGLPQHVDDARAVGAEGGGEAGGQGEQERDAEPLARHRRVQAEVRQPGDEPAQGGHLRQRADDQGGPAHPEDAAHGADGHRLRKDQGHDLAAREAEGLEHRDLHAPLAHGHAHGVGGDEEDGEDHGQSDAVEQESEVPDHGHEVGAEGGFRLRLGLRLAVVEDGVDGLAHRCRLSTVLAVHHV